jgi:hypothetical protein
VIASTAITSTRSRLRHTGERVTAKKALSEARARMDSRITLVCHLIPFLPEWWLTPA